MAEAFTPNDNDNLRNSSPVKKGSIHMYFPTLPLASNIFSREEPGEKLGKFPLNKKN